MEYEKSEALQDHLLRNALKNHLSRLGMFDSPKRLPDVESAKDKIIDDLGDCPSIETLEEVLSYFKNQRLAILREDIPATLSEYGLASCKMDDGTEVGKETVWESKQVDPVRAAEWCNTHGMGDLIKDNLTFPKGEFSEEIANFLKERNYSYTHDTSINGQTLKAALKRHIEDGGELPPEDVIRIKPFTQAKIKYPKGGF